MVQILFTVFGWVIFTKMPKLYKITVLYCTRLTTVVRNFVKYLKFAKKCPFSRHALTFTATRDVCVFGTNDQL